MCAAARLATIVPTTRRPPNQTDRDRGPSLTKTTSHRSELNMKVVPLGDKLVVRRLETDATTSGGIVLPDSAREKPQQGRVVSVGDGKLLADGSRAAHDVSEGDRVLFSAYSGSEVTVDAEELLIMSEDDILAIVG